jgi:hypothetical protein
MPASPKAVVAIPTPRGDVHLHSPTDDPDFLQRVSKAVHQAAGGDAPKPDPRVVARLVNGGSRLAYDAGQTMDLMDSAARPAFRDAVKTAIDDKAKGDPVKARKILYSMSDTARNIFGDTYDQTRQEFDKASRATLK